MFELTNELLINVSLLIIIFYASYRALKKALKNTGASIIASLSITMIAIFYLSNNQLEFITNLYGVTGIIILVFVPLLIVFFFIYTLDIGGFLRKIFWIFYGLITIFLLQNSNYISSETSTETAVWIFFLIILIILFDSLIKNKINAIKNLKKIR